MLMFKGVQIFRSTCRTHTHTTHVIVVKSALTVHEGMKVLFSVFLGNVLELIFEYFFLIKSAYEAQLSRNALKLAPYQLSE